MRNKTYTINEYLSERSSKEDFIFVNTILSDFIGKCIWMQPKKKGWRYNYYTIPLYMIKDIDKENSRLIVQPIKAHIVKVDHDYADYSDYTTFKYEIDTKKKPTSLKLGLVNPHTVKVGATYVALHEIKELDFSKEERICTYYRLYD